MTKGGSLEIHYTKNANLARLRTVPDQFWHGSGPCQIRACQIFWHGSGPCQIFDLARQSGTAKVRAKSGTLLARSLAVPDLLLNQKKYLRNLAQFIVVPNFV